MARFDECLKFVLNHEGRTTGEDAGDVNTAWGVTQPVYDEYRALKRLPQQNVDLGDEAEFRDIYLTRYWLGGKCEQLPPPLDMIHFDSRVNIGEGTANRMLQTALGMNLIDGVLGQKTMENVGVANPLVTGARYCNLRITRYMVITATRPDKKKYLRGWLHRIGDLLQLL